tara:strand:+ start:631 stop:867 length:237 start_codon:yes stop_codon:yes gene_type:complete
VRRGLIGDFRANRMPKQFCLHGDCARISQKDLCEPNVKADASNTAGIPLVMNNLFCPECYFTRNEILAPNYRNDSDKL